MAASYRIDVFHGSSPTGSAFPSGGRFHRADTTPTSDVATSPIPVPTSGTAYSWRKHLKLNVISAPAGSVSNLRFFSDGTTWGTGITCYCKTSTTYVQGSATDNTVLFDAGAADVTTYTSASPLAVNAGVVLTGTTGYGTQDYVVLQVGGTSAVAAGTTATRTLTYRVDET